MNETCLMMHKNSSCPQLWPYPCDKCGNRYKNRGKLREHVLSKCGTEKVFVCKVCNKSYLHERQLVEHVTPVCKNSLLFRCDLCNNTFKSQQRLNEHVLSKCDREKVFKCDTCKKRYILKSQLIEHLTPICRALRRLKCEHCEMTFKRALALNLHKSNAHGIGNQILCDKCGEVVNGPEQFRVHKKKHRFKSSGFDMYDLEEKSYLCKFCGKCLKSKVTLRGHLRMHCDSQLLACKICGKSVRRLSLRAHMRNHANVKAFSCRICQKGFHKRKDLERHMAGHSNEKPYFCRDCGKSFVSMDQLRSHSAVHTGLKSHFCNICGNSYLNRFSLKRHVQRVHLSKKNNICTQCGMRFQTLEDILDHHQHEPNCAETKCDVKPYVCHDCETCFESSESLFYHTGINLSDEPLMCNTCGKYFPRITCLDSHLLTHRDTFNCDKCGESFGDSLSLGLHNAICAIIQNVSNNEFTLTASDDKCCCCSQCGDQFNNIYDLTCHALSHISDEPLKFESVDIKSTVEHFPDDSNIRKQIIIDVPLKFESVHNVNSLPDNGTKDYHSLTQVSDMPIKFESDPVLSVPGEHFPTDSHTISFNSDVALGLKYERDNEASSNFENRSNNVQSETPLHLKGDAGIKRFTCNECGKCLAHGRSLRRHMVKVHSQLPHKNADTPPVAPFEHVPEIKPVVCKGCGKTFRHGRSLRRHMMTVHSQLHNQNAEIPPVTTFEHVPEIKPVVCKVQTTAIQDNFLQNNSFKQIDEPDIMSHVAVSEIKPVVCEGCGRAFSEMRHMKRHICKVHPTTTQNNIPQNNGLKQTDEPAPTRLVPLRERKPVICEGCGRTFSEARHLKRHICKVRFTKMQTNVMQDNSFNHTREPSVVSCVPAQDLKEEQEACNESGVVFSMPLLTSPCPIDLSCALSTNKLEKISCDAPVSEITTPECHTCQKTFNNTKSLERHNVKLHSKPTQIGPISCDVCGKVFQQRYNLNRHKIVHLTEMPFKCYVCNKAFKQDKALQNHMVETHRLQISESSFPCDTCGKLFAIKSRLQGHIRRAHGKFECDDCGIIFKKSTNLSKHRMSVHDEKVKCSICHLVCTSTDTLVEHIRFIHKEIIDESAPSQDLNSMYRHQNSFLEEKETNAEVESPLETKRVELKLPLNDKNMLMFEAYESLLLEACPLEPSVLAKKVQEDINHESSEEDLVKLEYVLGS